MTTMNGSSWIRREKRVAIYLRDGWKCVYCQMCLKNVPAAWRHLDHVLPRAHGGGNDATNLVTCCAVCNGAKGDLTLDQFTDSKRIVARIVAALNKPLPMARAKALVKLAKVIVEA